MEAFPLLVQWKVNPDVYHGFLSLMDKELEVLIELPSARGRTTAEAESYPEPEQSVNGILVNRHGSISGTEELKEILNGHEAQLRQKMDEAKDMESFLIELVDTLEAILITKRASTYQGTSVTYFSQVTKQLDALGWHKITQLSQDLSQVQIELRDASKRRHLLTVTFPPGHPTVPLIMEPLEIPKSESEHGLAMDFMSTTSSSRQGLELEGVIQQAEEQLKRYSEFWDVIQDLDEKTWVIDPEKPTRADRMRRCALGNHCSIQITIDPLSPRSMPETRLFGPTSSIELMRAKLHENAQLWDSEKFPRENLEVLLEMPNGFPSPTTVTKDEMNIECGICYSFRYEGQVPDQLCSHTKCQQPFHRVCLYEWLRSVPTTRQSFHTLFGACPYCSETITTTAPKT